MCPHKVDVNVKFDLSAMKYIARHRRIAIEQCIDVLTHSCLCHDAFCRRSSCMKMKRVVIHTSICKRKLKGDCPICKQLIALCCYHAKNCKKVRCSVPFCTTVKTKIWRQNLLFDRLDAARGLQRASQPDPDESDAIDVNMSGPYPFGDDGPSGSGAGSGASGAGDGSDASDSGDDARPDDEARADGETRADETRDENEGRDDDETRDENEGRVDDETRDDNEGRHDEDMRQEDAARPADSPQFDNDQSSDSSESLQEETPLN